MFESRAKDFQDRMNLTKRFEELKRLAAKVTDLNEVVETSADEGKRQTALDEMRAIRDECVRICRDEKFLMPEFRDRNKFIIDL